MKAFLLAATFAATIAGPAAAQNFPLEPGDYMEMGMIDVEDGGAFEYAQFLASQWRKNQEFAKRQRWIKDYKVLSNANPREGEPDLYLVTIFSSLPDAAEDKRRQEAYRRMMAQSDAQMEAASGDRVKVRKVMGSMLLRELTFTR